MSIKKNYCQELNAKLIWNPHAMVPTEKLSARKVLISIY